MVQLGVIIIQFIILYQIEIFWISPRKKIDQFHFCVPSPQLFALFAIYWRNCLFSIIFLWFRKADISFRKRVRVSELIS